jgi:hypothetical protein
MANTFTSLHYHIIFSTKHREPWIARDQAAGCAMDRSLESII